ncbi:exported hypothetical protein [Kamptonema sp. PCC 6506]|nr:exported hypothetical protein [Kamptonema sp. PCC 6506]
MTVFAATGVGTLAGTAAVEAEGSDFLSLDACQKPSSAIAMAAAIANKTVHRPAGFENVLSFGHDSFPIILN